MDIQQILRALVKSADVATVLDEMGAGATPADLVAQLRTPDGRRQLAALRRLWMLHSRLLAGKFGPFAVHRLVEMLGDEKAEIRLKGAQELLKLLDLESLPKARKRDLKPPPPPGAEGLGADAAALMEAIAEVLERRSPAS